ncbi:MAG: type II secretion system protein M [bacterium]|nr:type II secretion system protein M [bacterium]
MIKISEKNKEPILVIGSLVGFLLFAVGIIYPILRHNLKLKQEVEDKRRRIENFSAIAEKKGIVQARLAYLKDKRQAFDQRLLSGDTPAVAAAELQTILNDMAAEHELTISSQRIINPKERGILLEVPVQITTQCTITKLKEFLFEIESYPKFLSVSNLNIRVYRIRDPKDVEARIDVSGFILNSKATLDKDKDKRKG